MVCSTLAIASLAGLPTAGALIQSDHGGFLKAHIWGGTVTIAAALFVFAAKWAQVKFDCSVQELTIDELQGEKQDPSSLEAVQVGNDGAVKA